jgi:hypothetical protein
MAGSITVSSITLDSDNNFSIRSNTGATILSANGNGLITGIASGSAITNAQLTTPTISSPTVSGNTSFDSGTLFVDATNDRVGVGTTNPTAKHHVVGGQSYITGSASAGAYSRWYNNAQTTGDLQIGQGWSSGSDNVGFLLNNSNADLRFGTNGTERMNIDSSGRVTMPYQPAFHVRVNSAAYLTTSPVPFSNAVFNTGSHFNTSTYRFTAPIAGKYYFVLNMYLACVNGADGYPRFRVNGSDRQYSYFYNVNTGSQIDNTISVNAIFNLSVSDYVDVTFNGGGTYYAGNQETNFFGYLLG